MIAKVFRLTIASGASAVSKIESLNKGTWTETENSQAGNYILPLNAYSSVVVRMPATYQGVKLNWQSTYAPNVAAVDTYDPDGSLVQAAVDSLGGKESIQPAHVSTIGYGVPYLADSGDAAQAQSQETLLIVVCKSPTGRRG